jgi:hypothetical protein
MDSSVKFFLWPRYFSWIDSMWGSCFEGKRISIFFVLEMLFMFFWGLNATGEFKKTFEDFKNTHVIL